ncbi:MAG: hypothetical protein IBJ11_12460 [Phycisphaerales bacterium]|nr:hypothetical protein [Phycisphaerales bacterium]
MTGTSRDDDAPTPHGPTPGEPRRYPFERTACTCRMCSISCEHLPGALAPPDLEPISRQLGFTDIHAFAREHLEASEGATLKMNDGRIVSLPTLVPKSRDDGSCLFYRGGRCTIHAVSPFGCAHVDAHMPEQEFARRANHSYELLLDDLEAGGAYTRVVADLRARGLTAKPLAERRERLVQAMKRERLV